MKTDTTKALADATLITNRLPQINPLCQVVLDAVTEQDRVAALEDCVTGWDGNVTVETVSQGMLARLQALGQPVTGILITRERLDQVIIEFADTLGPLPELMIGVRAGMPNLHPAFFHDAEMKKIEECLLKNFHH